MIDSLDVFKKLRYFDIVIKLDPSLEADWDEDNVNHIAEHGLRPQKQVEEVYYSEGPFPTLALKTKKKRGRVTEFRYRLWGTDASGTLLKQLLPHTLNLGSGGVSLHFPCHRLHKKHI